MGSMLRSDPMSFCDVFLQPEVAFEIISQFGEMGCAQFLDTAKEWNSLLESVFPESYNLGSLKEELIGSYRHTCYTVDRIVAYHQMRLQLNMNPDVQAFQRNYISEVCRCAEMERRLRTMETEMIKDKIYIPQPSVEPKALQPNEMVMLDNTIEKWEQDVMEMAQNQVELMKDFLELTEMNYVLSKIGSILGNAEIRRDPLFTGLSAKGGGDIGMGGHLMVTTGVVRRSRCFHFEMMLWRISRGNIYYRQASEDLDSIDPYSGNKIRKVAFLAACQGEMLNNCMHKVLAGFGATAYPCPETAEERMNMINKITDRLDDLEQVLQKSKYLQCKALRTVGRQWETWMIKIRKAKAIYHHMNLFSLDISKNCLIGQCWVPEKDLPQIQDMLEHCSEITGMNVPSFMSKTRTHQVPPTFNRTNKFTSGFQALINAYGDSKYGELNPGLYTVITFPFLFALMFGDVGHAILLVAFSSWMIKNEKKYMGKQLPNEIASIFFGGRYVILLLGLFSIYTGFIYNDWFGKCVIIGKSYWQNTKNVEELASSHFISIDPAGELRTPYIFGIDPVWMLSTNKIMVSNSIKMKLSIIIGIVHMIFGLSLSLVNYIYFKQYYSIFLQFIPEVLFLVCIFFWLVILMYYKWFVYSAQSPNIKTSAGCAPLILLLFIDMVLMTESKPLEEECDAYMFNGQRKLQMTLLIIALASVPVLLFGTPIYVNKLNKKKRAEVSRKLRDFRLYQEADTVDTKEEELLIAELAKIPAFGELMIHQAVHTIEFVLSTISHTASYLRLWALSLAHAQLSEMLWIMVLSEFGLHSKSIIGLFLSFAVWATFTLSILALMEGLSAFLHTLRLHWVEFMSKFFIGEGLPFKPFSFKTLLAVKHDKPEGACGGRGKRRQRR